MRKCDPFRARRLSGAQGGCALRTVRAPDAEVRSVSSEATVPYAFNSWVPGERGPTLTSGSGGWVEQSRGTLGCGPVATGMKRFFPRRTPWLGSSVTPFPFSLATNPASACGVTLPKPSIGFDICSSTFDAETVNPVRQAAVKEQDALGFGDAIDGMAAVAKGWNRFTRYAARLPQLPCGPSTPCSRDHHRRGRSLRSFPGLPA